MSVVTLSLSKKETTGDLIDARAVEITILKSLTDVAWAHAKSVKDANALAALAGDIDAISDDHDTLQISSDDKSRLVAAFEVTAGQQRMGVVGWIRLGRSLLKQLAE